MAKSNCFVRLRHLAPVVCALLAQLLFAACAPAANPLQPVTEEKQPGTATMLPAAATPVPATASIQEEMTVQEAAASRTFETPEAASYPLAAPGPYAVGKTEFEFVDESRDGRPVSIGIWYPAQLTPDAAAGDEVDDAPPDYSRAPYPLVLGSSKTGGDFGAHLASHGFVMAGVRGMDAANSWGDWLIDYPLDILFILNQLAAVPIPGIEGLIDADHAGAMGYSFDGYNALSLSGARVDPEFYLNHCADPAADGPAPESWWVSYICTPAEDWDSLAANAGETITASEDGLWQPMTDVRIRAVMPMAPEGAWLFGERGLAAADRPVLIIAATKDTLNYYDLEAVSIYEQLGSPDRFLISFIGEGHMMIYSWTKKDKMAHFATAFFGTYLQGRGDLAPYFQEDFVSGRDELAWGVYEGD